MGSSHRLRARYAAATGELAGAGTGAGALWAYMEERELIRLQKEGGIPAPWTADPILGSAYFTNVHREDDKVSRWIQANITDPFTDHSQLPLMLGVARWINRPATLRHLLDTAWIEKGTHAELERMADSLIIAYLAELQIFGGAYVISANGMRWGNWETKHEYIIRGVVGEMVGKEFPLETLEGFTAALVALPGWGPFMSYEVACDLRWAPGWLDKAPDIYTWANPGPGAYRGLIDVFGGAALASRRNRGYAVELMHTLLVGASNHEWGIPWERPFEMRDIEHSLCEFNKYRRIAAGDRPRRRYPPK